MLFHSKPRFPGALVLSETQKTCGWNVLVCIFLYLQYSLFWNVPGKDHIFANSSWFYTILQSHKEHMPENVIGICLAVV